MSPLRAWRYSDHPSLGVRFPAVFGGTETKSGFLVDNVGDLSAARSTYCQIPSRQVIIADTTLGADTGIRVGDTANLDKATTSLLTLTKPHSTNNH